MARNIEPAREERATALPRHTNGRKELSLLLQSAEPPLVGGSNRDSRQALHRSADFSFVIVLV